MSPELRAMAFSTRDHAGGGASTASLQHENGHGDLLTLRPSTFVREKFVSEEEVGWLCSIYLFRLCCVEVGMH